ncbi:MAG: 3-deoxy-D-manno-octulosonic acid transferase [Bacteroidales bacterium]|nr:3-deoxy-D-manno-octulosonic acid transferase [Bacteroidales bacterium]
MIRGQHRTHDTLVKCLADKPGCIWFHASSLGEFEQGRPMIERLRREHPEKPILLSFFSPSGFEVRKNYPFVDAVVYLPFDTPHRVRRFLDAARPSMAIFIKYEFWGNYLNELRRRGIPTYIISSIFRPGQRFFRKTGGMFRKMLRCFNRLYVQDERSRRLLKIIGIENVTVAGDTRFDRVTDVMRSTVEIPGFPGFGEDAPLRFIAGSSWEADEDIYVPWLNAHPEVKFIIAPHEFNETRLEHLRNRFTKPAILLSEWTSEIKRAKLPDGAIPPHLKNVSGIIIDSFGKLSSLYRYADIAYIGGGFGAGIHNLNEAAVYGMPVIFGPNHAKFKEASDLITCGGGFSVATREEFNSVINHLASTPYALGHAGEEAGRYIRDHLGATDIIYRDLFEKQEFAE